MPQGVGSPGFSQLNWFHAGHLGMVGKKEEQLPFIFECGLSGAQLGQDSVERLSFDQDLVS